MYILLCSNGRYYTGSAKYLDRRIDQHKNGKGANYTKEHGPVELVYFEKYDRIDLAFYREKQVQGWSHVKKRALIEGRFSKLKEIANPRKDNTQNLDD